ncbi:MFS transporter [Microbacterium terregens]
MQASVVGTTIEFYDFTLYGFAAVLVFGPQFFPGADPVAGQLGALATFAVGFVMRPLGAVIGGHIGDRLGRKRVLIGTFLIMGLVTVAIAFIPTYAAIGILAPILLALLRMVQGLAAGAEWGGAAVMAVEHAPANKRGLYGIAPALGTTGGIFLAVSVMLLVSVLGPTTFVEFGWRIAFGLSAVLVVFGVIARRRLTESPLFIKAVEQEPARVPLARLIRRHPGALLRGVLYILAIAAFGSTVSPYAVGWAVGTLGYSQDTMLLATAIGAVVGLALMVLTGRFLDGRRRARTVIIVMALLVPVSIAFFPILSIGGVGAAILGLVVGYGAAAACQSTAGSVLTEMFPTDVALTGVSTAYALAYCIAGFLPLAAAAFVAATGSILPVVVINVVISLTSLTVAITHFRRKRLAGVVAAP